MILKIYLPKKEREQQQKGKRNKKFTGKCKKKTLKPMFFMIWLQYGWWPPITLISKNWFTLNLSFLFLSFLSCGLIIITYHAHIRHLYTTTENHTKQSKKQESIVNQKLIFVAVSKILNCDQKGHFNFYCKYSFVGSNMLKHLTCPFTTPESSSNKKMPGIYKSFNNFGLSK